MKTKTWNVLIIDDHPLIIDAYKNATEIIKGLHPKWEFKLTEATSCDRAEEILKNKWKDNSLDLVFLDIMLPSGNGSKFHSGEDLGQEIRKSHSSARIIVVTSLNNNYRIRNIFSSLNPEGFFIKTDIILETMVPAVIDILNNNPYYSVSVLHAIRKYMGHDFILDKWDRLMLYELSRGTRMKELPDIMPFSIGAIEKRKRNLKCVFEVEEGEDRDLLMKARAYGFI